MLRREVALSKPNFVRAVLHPFRIVAMQSEHSEAGTLPEGASVLR